MLNWINDWKNTIATGLFFISLFWLHRLTGFPPLEFLPVVFSVWASVLLLLAMVQRFLVIKEKTPTKRSSVIVTVRFRCGGQLQTDTPQELSELLADPSGLVADHIEAGCGPYEWFFKGEIDQYEASTYLPDGEFDVIPHDDGLIFRVR